MMQRVLAILLTALLLGVATALELPAQGGSVVLVSAEGKVVGAGELENGNLELELLAGFTGFATLTIVDGEGNELSVAEVMVGSDSSIVLSSTLDELRDLIEESGGELTIRNEDSVEGSASMGFGAGVAGHVELPAVAREGMEEAARHAEEARERGEDAREKAEEAREHADEERSDGAEASAEARAGARGEASAGARSKDDHGEGAESGASAEAEVGVSIGVGVGAGGGSDR